jgi:glycolate oxidase
MDRYHRAVDDAASLGLDRDAGAMLMVESDAGGAATRTSSIVRGACTGPGRPAGASEGPDRGRLATSGPTAAHSSLERAGVARMDDVGVPRSRVPEMLAAIERISAAHDLPVGVFGHAGDGNLHPTFVVDRDDPTAESRINSARAAIYQAAIDLGGTITGEHGTGVAKRAFLEAQLGPRAVEVMRSVKAALDPQGILNPGKVL